jgi:hypothetical protein
MLAGRYFHHPRLPNRLRFQIEVVVGDVRATERKHALERERINVP